jgi:hypothetical protein
MAISFGIGVAIDAFWGGGWGWAAAAGNGNSQFGLQASHRESTDFRECMTEHAPRVTYQSCVAHFCKEAVVAIQYRIPTVTTTN